MLKSIQGIIESCQLKKQGETKGRKWTIYDVIINGEYFSTFDSKFLSHIGTQGNWEYEEKQDGQYTNRTLGRYPEVKVASQNIDEGLINAFGVIRGDIKTLKESMDAQFNSIKEIINSLSIEEEDISNPQGKETVQTTNGPDGMEIPVINEDTPIQ